MSIAMLVVPAMARADAFKIMNQRGTVLLEVINGRRSSSVPATTAQNGASDAERLGSGQFGQVFAGGSEHHGRVAIKVMSHEAPTHEKSRLAQEAAVMRAVGGAAGFAELHYAGSQIVFGRPSDVLVMDLMGDPVQKRCWPSRGCRLGGGKLSKAEAGDLMCEGSYYSAEGLRRLGSDMLRCLRTLHTAGWLHNDLKPTNMLYGAAGSGQEDRVFLVDFGTASRVGGSGPADGEGLEFGGGTPLFASLAQLEGRPTSPADDVESLWYCLAFLAAGALPWQWEPPQRVANIKRRLFVEGCAVVSETCDAQLASQECCSTNHCLATYDEWDVSAALHELWGCVLEAHASPEGVDYDECLLVFEDPLPD